MTKQNIPKVRFVGFDKEWEQEKLGSKTGLITKGTTPKNQTANGTISFIKVENIADGKIFPTVKISAEEHESYLKRSILKEDDILFSIAGTLGRTAVVREDILPANTNQALAILRGYDFNESFLLTSLTGKIVKEYIRKNPTVGAQPNISLKQVGDLPISFPSNTEQKKIGSLFSAVDSLLSSYKDNLENYQSFKKSMLSKMFPKGGQTVPEIRLDGFEGEWMTKGLEDEVDFFSGLTYSPDDVRKNGTLVLRSSNIQNNSIIFEDNIYVKSNCATSEKINKNDIIVVVRNGSRSLIGKHALVKTSIDNAVIGAFMTGIRAKNYEFITAQLDHENFKKEIHKNLGATINQITTGDFKKMNFMFPKPDEQRAIGSFFSNLDELISYYQTKIEELETLKKKLLQDMFI